MDAKLRTQILKAYDDPEIMDVCQFIRCTHDIMKEWKRDTPITRKETETILAIIENPESVYAHWISDRPFRDRYFDLLSRLLTRAYNEKKED